MVDLSEMQHDARFVHSMNASVRNLDKGRICEVLSHMGECLSSRKMNRKIAVVAGIIFDYEIDQVFYAQELSDTINRKYLRVNGRIGVNSVANILKYTTTWGLTQAIPVPIRRVDDKRTPGTKYRRLK